MTFDIIYVDFPWNHYGDPNKNAAAGKHYDLMLLEDICNLDINSICNKNTAIFMWATCPRLPDAIQAMKRLGFNYRGIAYVWVKVNKQGKIIAGQGVPPTFTKPTTELVLVGTKCKKGRSFPLQSFNQAQVVLSQRGKHSEKPLVFRRMIDALCGNRPRVELFARGSSKMDDGWIRVGKGIDGQDIKDALKQLELGTYI